MEAERDWRDDLDPETRATVDLMMAGPSRPVALTLSILTFLLALELAVMVLWQWWWWFGVTVQYFSGWGLVVGGLVAAVQIVMLFHERPVSTCAMPAQPETHGDP